MPINVKTTAPASPDPDDRRKQKTASSFKAGTPRTESQQASDIPYAKGRTEKLPIVRTAQFQGAGWNAIYAPPQVFNPIQTPQQWQIASKRREVYQWARHWYDNEPKVAAGIDFYAQFPMCGFKLECKKSHIKRYFDKLVEDLKLNYWLRYISHEYYLLGDVFPFMEIQCDHCHGKGVDNEGQPCKHIDGKFKRIECLNPDFIEVQRNHIDDRPDIFMIPDEQLKMVVMKKIEPIYSRLDPYVRECVAGNRPIKLSSRSCSHIRHNAAPYQIYGTSLLRRMFTTLAYKTKLMTANWIVAERLVLPVRICKVGDKDRPATAEDIEDMQRNLSAIAMDPNMTIVTHHAVDLDYVGATGKIHQISQEMELIGKEILDGFMLNQALLNGEMGHYSCMCSQTMTLCKSGWKNYEQINENDEIATYNPDTGLIEYHPYTAKYVYDFDGEMIRFHTDKIDALVTPNHRMWSKKRDGNKFEFVRADAVRPRAKVVSRISGFVPSDDADDFISVGDRVFSPDDFVDLVAYYVTEGYTTFYKNSDTGVETRTAVCVAQTPNGKVWNEITDLFDRCFENHKYYESSNAFVERNEEIAKWLDVNCGRGAANKRLPQGIRNLSPNKLERLLWAMIGGDGTQTNGKTDGRKESNYTYTTVSKQLALDFVEVAVKCGFTTSMRVEQPQHNTAGLTNSYGHIIQGVLPQYKVLISKGFKGVEPSLESKAAETKGKEISREYYKGKVYCFEVPHQLFVVMRNGKVMVTGNSAQVGVEAILHRLESWRNMLSDWVYEHIFKPTAMMQGFVDEEATAELQQATEDENDIVYLYPKIKWNDMQLRDNSQQMQIYIQLNQEGKLSNDTMLKKLDLSWDEEVEKMRGEQAEVGPNGQMPGGQGGGGMGGGGGGGMGGGPPAGGDPTGGMGGMDPTGGMGGGAMAPGAGMGGGGAAPMGAAAGSTMRVNKKGQGPKPGENEQVPQNTTIKLTKLERLVWKAIEQLDIPFTLMGQFKIAAPGEPQPYQMDFAYPAVKVDIEADGPFHETEKAKANNMQRDQKLAAMGWRILRFKEDAINEHLEEVKNIIYANVYEAAQGLKKGQEKKASIVSLEKNIQLECAEIFDEKTGFKIGSVISPCITD